jgi:hypothetical protein
MAGGVTFLLPHIDEWLLDLFSPDQLEANTDLVRSALAQVDDGVAAEFARLQAEERDAQRQVDNFLAAIAGGVTTEPTITALNEARARVTAAQNRRKRLRGTTPDIDASTVREALAAPGALMELLAETTPAERAALYRSVGLRVLIDHSTATAKSC